MSEELPHKISRDLTGLSIKYDCPSCKAKLQSVVDTAGKRESCGECGAGFTVPGRTKLKNMKQLQALKEQEALAQRERRALEKQELAEEKKRLKARKKEAQSEFARKAREQEQQYAHEEAQAQRNASRNAQPQGSIQVVVNVPRTASWAEALIVVAYSLLCLFSIAEIASFTLQLSEAENLIQVASSGASHSTYLIGGYVIVRCAEKVLRAIGKTST